MKKGIAIKITPKKAGIPVAGESCVEMTAILDFENPRVYRVSKHTYFERSWSGLIMLHLGVREHPENPEKVTIRTLPMSDQQLRKVVASGQKSLKSGGEGMIVFEYKDKDKRGVMFKREMVVKFVQAAQAVLADISAPKIRSIKKLKTIKIC